MGGNPELGGSSLLVEFPVSLLVFEIQPRTPASSQRRIQPVIGNRVWRSYVCKTVFTFLAGSYLISSVFIL